MMTEANIVAELLMREDIGVNAYYPKTDLLSDIGIKFIWISRFLRKNENLFKELESSIHTKMIKTANPENGKVYELPCLYEDEIDKVELAKIISSNFPVVVRGLLKDSFAVKNWSLDHLKNNYGDAVTTCLEHREDENKYDTPHYQVHTTSQLTVSEIIDNIRSRKRKHAVACSSIFGSHVKTLKEVELKKIEELFDCKVFRPELFIAGPQNRTNFHCAAGGNIFCQVHGEKQWVFVAPWHSAWIYPNIGYSGSGAYVGSPVITKKQEKDSSYYPLYNCVPKYVVRVKPGDILFTPPWWWHEVSNLSETIGMPLRIPKGGTFQPTNLLYNLFTIFGSSVAFKSMLKILNNQIDVDDSSVAEALNKKVD